MIRKFINNILDGVQQQAIPYPNPFTKHELSHLGWLINYAPCFCVNAENVNILWEPKQFYETLIRHSKEAKQRITLASLYLGNGDLEKKLVDAILSNKNIEKLKLEVLLDYTRGTRGLNNSRKMLQPLIEGNKNISISLYHTPELRGLYKKFAPNRWNELMGIQHMKLYIFDDTLIISGANLSNDYFTNRQDRYFIIQDRTLCDFYSGLVEQVQRFSLTLGKNDYVTLRNDWSLSPYEGSKQAFVTNAGDKVEKYLVHSLQEQNNHLKHEADTWIFPLVQMGQLGIQQDAFITDQIFAEAPPNSKIKIATAYFNLTQSYIDTIIQKSKAHYSVLMAHPKANGFLGAKGMAGGIPDGYSLIARHFRDKLFDRGQEHRIELLEYLRDGWTYHAKGLWYYHPDAKFPCLTLIGSSNFGDRSVHKDLETQIAIVTQNEKLQLQLHEECDRLYKLGRPAQLNRSIPAWVYAMVFMFRNFF